MIDDTIIIYLQKVAQNYSAHNKRHLRAYEYLKVALIDSAYDLYFIAYTYIRVLLNESAHQI